MLRPLNWDLFCTVIDNHGDLGVCWRLACGLAERGQQVRLWVDDDRALAWMAPQGCPGVQVLPWSQASQAAQPPLPATDVLVEAFGCDIPAAFLSATVRARAGRVQPAWINLEYLSAEAYVERSHALPSPVMTGPARGWSKRFFYPGFTPRTGGLLREPDLMARRQAFDAPAWLAARGLAAAGSFVASLFCYEPAALPGLLQHWAQHGHHGRPVRLLVTAGRATDAVRACQPEGLTGGRLSLHALPYLNQIDFDHLLWASEFNLVRGEDSLVRALWAGQPMVWQLYPQTDGAHLPKMHAFLDTVQAHPASRQWHAAWNPPPGAGTVPLSYPGPEAWQAWRVQALACRQALLAQADLATQLLGFVAKTG